MSDEDGERCGNSPIDETREENGVCVACIQSCHVPYVPV